LHELEELDLSFFQETEKFSFLNGGYGFTGGWTLHGMQNVRKGCCVCVFVFFFFCFFASSKGVVNSGPDSSAGQRRRNWVARCDLQFGDWQHGVWTLEARSVRRIGGCAWPRCCRRLQTLQHEYLFTWLPWSTADCRVFLKLHPTHPQNYSVGYLYTCPSSSNMDILTAPTGIGTGCDSWNPLLEGHH
jgi:hypothetical protein